MNKRWMPLLLPLVVACGPSVSVRYSLKDVPVQPFPAVDKVVGVKRPILADDLVQQDLAGDKAYDCTDLSSAREELAEQIGRQLTRHLAHTNLFTKVVYLPDHPGAEVDLVFGGLVREFAACAYDRERELTGEELAILLAGAAAAGVSQALGGDTASHFARQELLAEAVLGPLKPPAISRVKLRGISLTDRSSGATLWEGNASAAVGESTGALAKMSALAIANIALERSVSSLISDLTTELGGTSAH